MSSLGINYDNMPSPFYQGDGNFQEKGENNLFPYLAIRGTEIFDNDSSIESKDNGVDSIPNGLNRFILNISPLNQSTYPNYGSLKTLVNLDTAQLYAPNPKIRYTYGGTWTAPAPEYCSPYFTNKEGGVYKNPTPIRGAPVEFKKVYFRGKLVDREKGYALDGDSGNCRTFHAVFACSNPIEQTIYQEEEDCDEPSGTLYNPRDENFSHSNYATERSWEEIDIFCGEGGSGSGCESFSTISGQTYDSYEGLGLTGYEASGCDNLIFSGCSGILTKLTDNQITVCYTGCQESFTGFHANFGEYKASGCDSFHFMGVSGIHTSITDNVLTITDTGCRETFTKFLGDAGNYEANGCDLFNFNGGTSIKTSISSNTLTISGPSFSSSGCLSVSTNTETNTITYGIGRSEIINCLGYIETGFRVLVPTGSEMPTGFEDLRMCEFQMLFKCPEDDTTYITGCCVDPVGACCENGSCSLKSSDDCGGRFWGVGTNCTDTQSVEGPTNYFYNFTIAQLCQRGTACLYDPVAQAYECAEIMGSNIISREEYYQLLATDNYNPDQAEGGANPSIFTQGATTCDCPTTTSTSTSTSTTTSTTTTTTTTTTSTTTFF